MGSIGQVLIKCVKSVFIKGVNTGEVLYKELIYSDCRSQVTKRSFTKFSGELWILKEKLVKR